MSQPNYIDKTAYGIFSLELNRLFININNIKYTQK